LLDPDSKILFNDLIEKNDESILLIIGPEGGVDDSEIELFTSAGAQSATLGETILRTSTAGGIAAAILLSKTRWIK
jgi:16S rRNA (uracil1498-N3)-methyltransferase